MRVHPFSTHSCMTAQMCSSDARVSSSGRQDPSLASMIPAIDLPSRRQCSRSRPPVVNGCGTSVVSWTTRSAPVASPSTTKPPPTE